MSALARAKQADKDLSDARQFVEVLDAESEKAAKDKKATKALSMKMTVRQELMQGSERIHSCPPFEAAFMTVVTRQFRELAGEALDMLADTRIDAWIAARLEVDSLVAQVQAAEESLAEVEIPPNVPEEPTVEQPEEEPPAPPAEPETPAEEPEEEPQPEEPPAEEPTVEEPAPPVDPDPVAEEPAEPEPTEETVEGPTEETLL